MARRERPISAESPLAEFATGLRELCSQARIKYRIMEDITYYSHDVLSRAANGKKLPTWDVTRAYVAACGGDVVEWRARWESARAGEVRR
jgi:hypothetical protein